MDIAVVDDEKVIRGHICALIEEQKPESSIEAYATGEELLAAGKHCAYIHHGYQGVCV